MSGRIIPSILGSWRGFPGSGPPLTFWPFVVGLRTVMVPVGVSVKYTNILQWAHNESQGLLGVQCSAILDLIGCNQFLLYPQRLCHSFKSCALPPSLLCHYHRFSDFIFSLNSLQLGSWKPRIVPAPEPIQMAVWDQPPQLIYFVKLGIKPCFRTDLGCVLPEVCFCSSLSTLSPYFTFKWIRNFRISVKSRSLLVLCCYFCFMPEPGCFEIYIS